MYIFCITFGILLCFMFFGAGVVIGRISKDPLHGHNNSDVLSGGNHHCVNCTVGDDLK